MGLFLLAVALDAVICKDYVVLETKGLAYKRERGGNVHKNHVLFSTRAR